jgi:hypothetical protein
MTYAQLRACLSSEDLFVRALAEEALRLHDAIRSHRDKTGHELCWLNDVELWKTIGENPAYPHDTLPVREEFLGQCSRFYESRLKGTAYAEPATKKTIVD